MKTKRWVKVVSTIMILVCLLLLALLLKAYTKGKFNSVETLQSYIAGYGPFAPIVLVTIQALQVVIPVLPGFLGSVVGAILFGCAGGFWCNYIGISSGSIIAFLLARRFGVGLVQSLFPKEKYDKLALWAATSKSYTALLFACMALPLVPGDFFCYFSGLTKIKVRKFVLIILLGKPWCLLVYAIVFSRIQ